MLKNKKYVGALTDKLYAFKNRCWELTSNNTADVYDSLGSNIKVYTYGSEVKRVLPLKNDFVNEEWISNKTRYFFDGLMKWRVNVPLMKKNESMVYVSWIQAFYYFLLKIWFFSFFFKSKNLVFFNSMFADYELIVTSKILMKKLGFLFFNKNTNININDYYLHYLNPNFFKDINEKNIFAFVGYNLRLESPILNIKLRKKSLRDDVLYLSFGSNFNDNLNSRNKGLSVINFIKYLQGKLKICNFALKKVNKKINFFDSNVFLLGNNIVNRIDSKSIFNIINQYKNLALNQLCSASSKGYLSHFFIKYSKINSPFFFEEVKLNVNLNVLYVNLTNLLYEEFGLYNNIHNLNKVSSNDLVYLLGIDMFNKINSKFTVFQGHHLNIDHLNVDLILPSTTFLEKFSNYINIEGSTIQTNFVLYPPFFCRNDWSILNALYIYIINFVYKIYNINFNKRINYLNVNRFYISINNMKKIMFYVKRMSVNFYFENITKYSFYSYAIISSINKTYSEIWKVYNSIISNKYHNPYNLNVINQHSDILKECSYHFNNSLHNYQNINKNV
jgi:NADH dehydrogenase (ubiquinone) Fe-S protein 1